MGIFPGIYVQINKSDLVLYETKKLTPILLTPEETLFLLKYVEVRRLSTWWTEALESGAYEWHRNNSPIQAIQGRINAA